MLRSFIGLEEGTVPRKTALLNDVLVLEEDNVSQNLPLNLGVSRHKTHMSNKMRFSKQQRTVS